jgi:hypothetical protein
METTNTVAFRELDFSNHYRARYGSYGKTYADYEFAYHFGYEFAVNPSYDGEFWLVIEMHVRSSWKGLYPDKQWADYRDAVRFAWLMTRNAINRR